MVVAKYLEKMMIKIYFTFQPVIFSMIQHSLTVLAWLP